MRLPMQCDGGPFATIRVGVSTVLLKDALRQALTSALLLAGGSILFTLLLAAILSNLALRPLEKINRKLDEMSAGAIPASQPTRTDEYGMVSHKIERLGQEMRDVKEVFSALKENLDQIMANLQDGVILVMEDKAAMVRASSEDFLHKRC